MSGQILREAVRANKRLGIIYVNGAAYYRNPQCRPSKFADRPRISSASWRDALAKAKQSNGSDLQSAVLRWQQGKSKTNRGNPMIAALSQGRKYTPRETQLMELEAQRRAFAMRREMLKGALTTRQVAELLGTNRQTPHDRIKSGKLLALEDNGHRLFPSWQFDAAGPNGVIEGLPETLKALNVSAFAKANWLTLPNPYLESRTPVQALKAGDVRRVVDIAQAVGAN